MVRWEIKEETAEAGGASYEREVKVLLYGDGTEVAGIWGHISAESHSFQRHFEVDDFRIATEHAGKQHFFIAERGGIKIGEMLAWKLLGVLKKEGISYISPWLPNKNAMRFIERFKREGIIRRTHDELEINWKKVPKTEEALGELARKIRAEEAGIRKGIFAKAKERLLRLRKMRPR